MSCNSDRYRNGFRCGFYPPYYPEYPYDADRRYPYAYDNFGVFDDDRFEDFFNDFRRRRCIRRAIRCCNRRF